MEGWCHIKPKSSICWISLYSLQNNMIQNILDMRYKLGLYWSIHWLHKGWHQEQCRGHCWPSMWWWRRWRWRWRWWWSSGEVTSLYKSCIGKLYWKMKYNFLGKKTHHLLKLTAKIGPWSGSLSIMSRFSFLLFCIGPHFLPDFTPLCLLLFPLSVCNDMSSSTQSLPYLAHMLTYKDNKNI